MSVSAAYVDTSAFVKLVIAEPESDALQQALLRWPVRVSSTLVRTEAVRALRRAGHGASVGAARRLFGGLRLLRLDEPMLDRAADLDPAELRSLDAVHLAAALSVVPDLGVFVTYDDRLALAAQASGLVVEAPS